MGLLVLTGAFFIYNFSNLQSSAISNVIPVYTYKVINAYPHDRSDTRSLDFKTKYYLLFHNMRNK